MEWSVEYGVQTEFCKHHDRLVAFCYDQRMYRKHHAPQRRHIDFFFVWYTYNFSIHICIIRVTTTAFEASCSKTNGCNVRPNSTRSKTSRAARQLAETRQSCGRESPLRILEHRTTQARLQLAVSSPGRQSKRLTLLAAASKLSIY